MVVTSAAGATNVMYEGLRCTTREVKTYVRYRPDNHWQSVADAQWRSVFDNLSPRHAMRFAKAGACKLGRGYGEAVENSLFWDLVPGRRDRLS